MRLFFRLYFLEDFVTHPIVSDFVVRLDANLVEFWQERAAILQFDAGIQRDLAEALAMLLVVRAYPKQVVCFLQ